MTTKIKIALTLYLFQHISLSLNCQNNFIWRITSGFFAPLYRTEVDMNIYRAEDTSKSQKILLPKNTYYWIVDDNKDIVHFKIASKAYIQDDTINIKSSRKERLKRNSICSNKKDTKNEIKQCLLNYNSDNYYHIEGLFFNPNPNKFNTRFRNGFTIGTLFLPIKIRPQIEVDGVEYQNFFSTDISVGPFFGYKYQAGTYYNQFVKFGIFAGPSLITIDKESLKPMTEPIDKLNALGLSTGLGVSGEFRRFEAGIILGWDWIGGELAKDWVYDGRYWISIGIGFTMFKEKE